MSDCGCHIEPSDEGQRSTLRAVLAINATMFAAEFIGGVIVESAGVVADSLDMLADAMVYAISLYAVARSNSTRRLAAKFSGVFQLLLGVGVLVESCRRFISGSEPIGMAMVGIGVVALAANLFCLKLLAKHRDGDVNFRASWIFSTNDVIANVGVIVSGVLVSLTATPYPDLLIGVLVAGAVVHGGFRILIEAREPTTRAAADE